jgi:RNA 2',3'-cyclic 3'-phosphodiesterase
MRFFIALEIPEPDKIQLANVQKKLQALIPGIRLTNPENLHLTIAFVGEQPDDLKDHLIEIIQKAAVDIPPFIVIPAYIDGFPHLHTARVLWVGVKADVDKLYELRHHIKDGLSDLNLPVDERRFVPHIAIGKMTNFNLTPEIEKELEKIMSQEFSPITITSVKLFESIPNKGFHSHNTLAQISLN